MWRRKESKVERAGRAPPSIPPPPSDLAASPQRQTIGGGRRTPTGSGGELHLCGSLQSQMKVNGLRFL